MFGTIGLGGIAPSATPASNNKARTKPTIADANGKGGSARKRSKKTTTGQPSSIVTVNGVVLESFPPHEKTAIVTIGRFNPPTRAHDRLVQTVYDLAEGFDAQPFVFTTSSADRRTNPLSYVEKINLLKEAYGPAVVALTPSSATNNKNNNVGLFEILEHLSSELKYDNVVIVCGGDRITKYTNALREYNNSPESGFAFNHVAVISIGDRIAATTTSLDEASPLLLDEEDDISTVSATDLRDAAKRGDFNAFSNGISRALNEAEIAECFRGVRLGLGLADALTAAHISEDAHILTPTERIQRARIFDRYRSKIDNRRQIAMSRRGTAAVINKRAKKLALEVMRKKLTGGQNYHALPYASRASIDQRLRGKTRAMNNLARKLVPRVKAAENRRFAARSNGVNESFEAFVEQHHPTIASFGSISELVRVADSMVDAFAE